MDNDNKGQEKKKDQARNEMDSESTDSTEE